MTSLNVSRGDIGVPEIFDLLSATMSWSRKLAKTLYTIDGKTLRTLNDARAYAVALPATSGAQKHWQRAAELMLAAAESGDVSAASEQIQKALFLDMRLDVVKTPV
jgi:hypothetical protein